MYVGICTNPLSDWVKNNNAEIYIPALLFYNYKTFFLTILYKKLNVKYFWKAAYTQGFKY